MNLITNIEPLRIILRSQSPRRKEIFENWGFSFQVIPLSIDESQNPDEPFLQYLERITLAKLGGAPEAQNEIWVSADTIVEIDGKILHKPQNEEDAFQILSHLMGRKHSVYTGYAVSGRGILHFEWDLAIVEFENWTNDQIITYIRSKQPYDKAGSYGIQDQPNPVKQFEGSYSTIMGFPILKFMKWLTESGLGTHIKE
jgi:septum formation protein